MSEVETILRKHLNPSILIKDNSEYTFQQIMEFAKEISDKSFEAGSTHGAEAQEKGWYEKLKYPDKETFINQLFIDK